MVHSVHFMKTNLKLRQVVRRQINKDCWNCYTAQEASQNPNDTCDACGWERDKHLTYRELLLALFGLPEGTLKADYDPLMHTYISGISDGKMFIDYHNNRKQIILDLTKDIEEQDEETLQALIELLV